MDKDDDVTAVEEGGSIPVRDLGLCAAVVHGAKDGLSIENLFSMQAIVTKQVISCRDRDVVLCAPTGSGKTMAYALPIVSLLSTRFVARLRAVIIVPTRDLAAQTYRVFRALTSRTKLGVALAVGESSASKEARSVCCADILVATPGRLIDHTTSTEQFSLQWVEFLVLDESDRLLQDFYHGWIEIIVPQCGRRRVEPHLDVPTGLAAVAIYPPMSLDANGEQKPLRKRPMMILASATQTRNPMKLAMLDLRRPKMYMATHINGVVHEHKRQLSVVDEDEETYCVPTTLTEKGVVVEEAQEKIFALARLLGMNFVEGWTELARTRKGEVRSLPVHGSRLVFTKSIESAHRLARLLELIVARARENIAVYEISGDLPAERRAFVIEALSKCRSDNPEGRQSEGGGMRANSIVVVCSDVLARGMDIRNVDAVINYDVPVYISTYLHRVGRTARAGNDGTAVTLLLSKQARHFKSMVRSVDRGSAKVKVRNAEWESEVHKIYSENIATLLLSLKRVLRREQLGLLRSDRCLPSHVLLELAVKPRPLRANERGGVDRLQGMRSEPSPSNDLVRSERDGTSAPGQFDDHDMFDVAQPDNGAVGAGDIDTDIGLLDAYQDQGDTFSDLIAAQIARNFLDRGS